MNLMALLKDIFLQKKLYYCLVTIAMISVFGYFVPIIFLLSKLVLAIIISLVILDFLLLFSIKNGIGAQRIIPPRFSNGDKNIISIIISSQYPFKVHIVVYDEIPYQFQIRDFKVEDHLLQGIDKTITYHLKPTERGEYKFGYIKIYVSGISGFLSKRYICSQPVIVAVYPSFIQMKKYEFLALNNRMEEAGIKKIRQKGIHSEFDQVREYVKGDDYRSMNWKATARRGNLMVNQYQDEKSKDIYCIIDKGRLMKMPFDGLTLLDYAINSSLVLSNIALLKHDKAGLITYNTEIDCFIGAESKAGQLGKIMLALYKQETAFKESNNELLYLSLKKKIHQRSLCILFNNFESLISVRRNLKPFKELSKNHLLLIVVFENREVEQFLNMRFYEPEDLYTQVIAQKFIFDKKLIIKELKQHGIHALYTKPQALTVNLINKYLEFKSLGMI